MPRERDAFGVAQEWLKRAKGNLARAKQRKSQEAFWDDFCFDAQQAAEKSIKAVLIRRQIDFPKTHNIRVLLELLDPQGNELATDIWKAVELSSYAVEIRYPGAAEPVTRREFRRALAVAEKVAWVSPDRDHPSSLTHPT